MGGARVLRAAPRAPVQVPRIHGPPTLYPGSPASFVLTSQSRSASMGSHDAGWNAAMPVG